MLLTQLIFVVLAFVVMVILSLTFMSNTMRASLVRNAEAVLLLTENHILETLEGYESAMGTYAKDMQQKLDQGENAQQLQEYIESAVHYSFVDGGGNSGVQDFFGYLETLPGGAAMIGGSGNQLSADYNATEQKWYQLAIEAKGEIAKTVPVLDDDGHTTYIYAQALSDRAGKRQAVICMQVNIDFLGQNVVDTALNQGGYGMLINQDWQVLFHPNEAFKGMDMRDPIIPISELAKDLEQGLAVVERPVISYTGEPALTFFRTLADGWHLGLVTPESQYYEGLSNVAIIISITALGLAAILITILIRLDAARARSDEESRQKSMFLANMSHEIRTPINAIVGMAAIGKAVGMAERKDYCFSRIDEASRHLLSVINDILDISKIEANKIELSPTDFVFEKMLRHVVDVNNFRIDEKHQELKVSIDKKIPRVLFADEHRIMQVITNLLSNAVKFTPENGSISLKAALLEKNENDYILQIDVQDSGIGIGKVQQDKIFKSFEQAESSTTRKYGGTGLGLAICKSIVELMGGKIWVESELGQGSTFAFTLHAQLGDEEKYGYFEHRLNWDNIRILIVDDDEDILEYFQEITRSFGAKCEAAKSAAEAYAFIEENGSYDVYFIDLKMPKINGIELTREIRKRESDPKDAVIIMISSADPSAVEAEASEAGVDKFLIKPIFPSAITDVIQESISASGDLAERLNTDRLGVFEGYRILLAEDVEINSEIVVALLEPTLLAIDIAENGVEAVQKFMRKPDDYDLILMDVQMPEMDGIEATRQIRSLDITRAKEIPIVAMTANVFKEDVERCLEAGMNDHLGKPLDADAMLQMIGKYLKGK